VAANRKLLTDPLRDELIARWFRADENGEVVFAVLLNAVARERKDERGLAFAAFCNARVLDRQERPAEAAQCYEYAAPRFRALREPTPEAISLDNLGSARASLGEYPRALEAHQKALPVWRRLHKGPNAHLATCLSNLGHAAFKSGEYTRARDALQEALAVRRKLHPGPDPEVASCLNELGLAHEYRGEHARCLELYEEALAMGRRLGRAGQAVVGTTLNHLGAAHARQGDYRKALEYHREALALRQKLSRAAPGPAVGAAPREGARPPPLRHRRPRVRSG
jgi:tetratricopeptide (TPR) repeat protein